MNSSSGDLETTDTAEINELNNSPVVLPDAMSTQRVFKKVSPNQKLTLYLCSRDLVVSPEGIDKLQGILLVDPEFVADEKVYGQVTLTFRYGREDEEVMGLKFCNEAIMCLVKLYPPDSAVPKFNTPLQEALLRRLGPNAYPFVMEIPPRSPPSVQLGPAKEYSGAPIGTSYDVRVFLDELDEKLYRQTSVRMGIKIIQRGFAPLSPVAHIPGNKKSCRGKAKYRKSLLSGCKSVPADTKFSENDQNISLELTSTYKNQTLDISEYSKINCNSPNYSVCEKKCQEIHHENRHDQKENREILVRDIDDESENCRTTCISKPPSTASYWAGIPFPRASTEKFCLLGDGKVYLTAMLDKAVYTHGEEIKLTIHVQNTSRKTVKSMKIIVVQQVNVCMFSNGKFKNIVAMLNAKDDCPISNGQSLKKSYTLTPTKISTRNWIALEASYNRTGTSLASTVTYTAHNSDDRNMFTIYVSYYVKVKLLVGVMGTKVSLKLPFTLTHSYEGTGNADTLTKISGNTTASRDAATTPDRCAKPVKPEKDGT